VGINLTSADTVILHDIDFNPFNDRQAEDRCHRVGQTRDVTIYKLVSLHTIEEYILENAERKLRLDQDLQSHDTTNDKAVAAAGAELLRQHLLSHHSAAAVAAASSSSSAANH